MSGHSQSTSVGLPLLQRLPWHRGKGDLGENGQSSPLEASGIEGVQEELAALEKHLSRVDREQFKARALAEAQTEQFTAALNMLRAAEARREAELDGMRRQSQADQRAARLEVVQALLPTLDSLDEALRSGGRLLEQRPALPHAPSLMDRLFARPVHEEPVDEALREAMAAWLTGLTFVRQRLLDVLAAEGVQPIAAEGQPFDPHYHVALEVVPPTESMAAGTVSAEVRRGYVTDGRVLRYAEVAVAGEAST